MQTTTTLAGDRRRRRSDDTITALHYQLSSTRQEAALEAVVLVDDRGCLVAGAGSWPTCEELAAYAPLLVDRNAIANGSVSSRIRAMTSDVEVHTLVIDGALAVLCGRGGGSDRKARLEHAASGCQRILSGRA